MLGWLLICGGTLDPFLEKYQRRSFLRLCHNFLIASRNSNPTVHPYSSFAELDPTKLEQNATVVPKTFTVLSLAGCLLWSFQLLNRYHKFREMSV